MSDAPYALVKSNPRFELGWNRLQLAIEFIVAALVLCGLLGLFGNGPLSHATTMLPGGAVEIDYERILRRSVQSDMEIRLVRPAISRSFAITLPTSFLQGMDVVSTSPRSSAMRAEADGITYVFDLGPEKRGTIAFTMKPKGFGLYTSPVRAEGVEAALHQIVLP